MDPHSNLSDERLSCLARAAFRSFGRMQHTSLFAVRLVRNRKSPERRNVLAEVHRRFMWHDLSDPRAPCYLRVQLLTHISPPQSGGLAMSVESAPFWATAAKGRPASGLLKRSSEEIRELSTELQPGRMEQERRQQPHIPVTFAHPDPGAPYISG